MENPPPLRLALIDQHNWRAALAVQVTPDQLRYVAGHQPVALVILSKAYVRPGDLDWEPLAVTAGASVLGVVALAHASTHTEVLHLAVDASKQGARHWVGGGGTPPCTRHRDPAGRGGCSACGAPRERTCAAPVPEPGLLAQRREAGRRAHLVAEPQAQVAVTKIYSSTAQRYRHPLECSGCKRRKAPKAPHHPVRGGAGPVVMRRGRMCCRGLP